MGGGYPPGYATAPYYAKASNELAVPISAPHCQATQLLT